MSTPDVTNLIARAEQLVDAGEAMLLELVKLTRQATRVSDADRTARAYQAAL